MRTRLAYTLSIWLLSAVALSVLAMGSLTAWNLREGFGAYLQARDVERLDRLAALLASRLADSPSAPQRPDMQALLREFAVQEGGGVPPRRQAPRPRPEFDPDGRRPGPPPGTGEGFGARVSLLRPDGQRWAGPPPPVDTPGLVERAVTVDGVLVARLLLRPMAPAPDAIEAQFLRSQYLGIAALALALMLLAWASALWLARQWTRPLAAVQDATARIAQGALDVRVPGDRSDEIGDVVRNVNAMAASLQRIEGARRRWLADLSHELRTPLTVLRGEIEALVDGIRLPDAAAMVSLRDDVMRLNTLVDDLHLLAMADLQALPCHPSPLDAVALVEGELQRHQRLATSSTTRATASSCTSRMRRTAAFRLPCPRATERHPARSMRARHEVMALWPSAS